VRVVTFEKMNEFEKIVAFRQNNIMLSIMTIDG